MLLSYQCRTDIAKKLIHNPQGMGVPSFSVLCEQSLISVVCPSVMFGTQYPVSSLQQLPGWWFPIALKRPNILFSLLRHFYLLSFQAASLS